MRARGGSRLALRSGGSRDRSRKWGQRQFSSMIVAIQRSSSKIVSDPFHPPRKRFGQHFLVDRRYVERILDALDPRPDDRIVEIGPGLGALTRPMLDRVSRLTVIEIDRDLAARLAAEFPPE